MKCRMYSAAVAVGVLALVGYSYGVKADTITETIIQDSGNAPVEGTALPNDTTGSFIQGQTGTDQGSYLSPYFFNTNGTQNAPYNIISKDNTGAGSATYNLGVNFFDFLWGSPDAYNIVTFYSGSDGTGTVEGSFTGASLSCYTSGECQDTEFSLTQFIDTTGIFGSVVLSDPTGNAAFEFGTAQGTTQLTTPVPGALALFAGGLGLLGLVGRRRRKTNQRLPMLSAV